MTQPNLSFTPPFPTHNIPNYYYPEPTLFTCITLLEMALNSDARKSYPDSTEYNDIAKTFTDEVSSLAEKWKNRILNRDAALTANELTVTVKPVFQTLTALGANAIDLRDLPVDQVNGVHLAVVLRATFKHRKRTHGWEEALAVARKALVRDGLEERDALAGLIK